MNVYGFSSPWQINSPREYPESSCTGWNPGQPNERAPPDPHIMTPPAAHPSPWTSAGLSWGSAPQPPLMHFTAHTPLVPHSTVVHCKRKPGDIDNVIPAKQLITEEKMAAHLNGLHISNNYTEHGEMPDAPSGFGNNSLGFGAASSGSTTAAPERMDVQEWLKGARTIVLADEIKKIQQEPLIPPSLLERLEKPCMSLMVWKPKENFLEKTNSDSDDEDETGSKNPSSVSRRRHGVLVAEGVTQLEDSCMDIEM